MTPKDLLRETGVRHTSDVGGVANSELKNNARDSEKHATEFIIGPLPVGFALNHAEDLREEVREGLAADLGREPGDYRADKCFDDEGERSGEAVPDGGE